MMTTMMILAAAVMSFGTPPGNDADSIGRSDYGAVSAASNRMNVPALHLYRAMSQPESPRRASDAVRFCVRRGDIVAGKTGMVCRTRNEWRGFGLEIDTGEG